MAEYKARMCKDPACRHTNWGGQDRLHEMFEDCPGNVVERQKIADVAGSYPLTVRRREDGTVELGIGPERSYFLGRYRESEVLEALGAVRKEDVLPGFTAVQEARDGEWRRAEDLAERLSEAEGSLRRILKNIDNGSHSLYSVRAALSDLVGPEPEPFELPDEGGVRFTAQRPDGSESTFRSVTLGAGEVLYLCEDTDVLWRAATVMDEDLLTGHRLLEGQ